MKKIFFLLLCFIAISATLFAAESDDVKVSWNLEVSTLKIGFYASATDSVVIEESGLPLTTKQTDGIIGEGTMFIKWDIATTDPVNVQIYSSAMTLDGTEQSDDKKIIDWEASIEKYAEGVPETKIVTLENTKIGNTAGGSDVYGNSTKPIKLFTYDDEKYGIGDSGCLKLSITTEDATEKAGGKYSTNVYVQIKKV